MDVNELLSEKQQNVIIEIIQNQCRKYRELTKQEKSLFYEPYTTMRKKYDLTSAVISGFAPGRLEVEGLVVEDLMYGLNNKLGQPEIKSENGVFHIYSDGSDLKGKKIRERAKYYNSDLTAYPLFFMIVFCANKDGVLNNVIVKIPNKDGNVVEEYMVYSAPKVTAISA